MCLCLCLSLCLHVWVCVGWEVSLSGRGSCKVSSLLSCRVDMQPTDMHSLLLQPQPQLLQPLQPLTATGMYRARAAGSRCPEHHAICSTIPFPLSPFPEPPLVPGPPAMAAPRPSLFLYSHVLSLHSQPSSSSDPFFAILKTYIKISQLLHLGNRHRKAFSICHFPC